MSKITSVIRSVSVPVSVSFAAATLMKSAVEASPVASDNAEDGAYFHTLLTFAILISNVGFEVYICNCSFKPNSFGDGRRFWSF